MIKKNNKTIVLIFLILLISIIIYIKKNTLIVKNKEPIFNSIRVKSKYKELVKYIGEPIYTETDKRNIIKSVTWQSPLKEYNGQGKFGGLDYIKLSGHIAKKQHPIPASVFVIVGKYINVPEHLFGPLKHASETINIEQIFVPKVYNDVYGETGEKEVALVTGSCASITISSITLKFVEDMIEKYKNNIDINSLDLYPEFRNEYDSRVQNYLCGGGIVPEMDWFSPELFGEPAVWNGDFPQCHNTPGISSNNNTCEDYLEETCPPSDCHWEEGKCIAA